MIRTLLISILILVQYNVLSQKSIDFPQDSFIWVTRFIHYNVSEPGFYIVDRYYLLNGDTIIDNNTYSKIYVTDIRDGNKVFSNNFHSLIRNDNGIIKSYRDSIEYVIYDFNLNIGDTFLIENPMVGTLQIELTNIDTLENDKPRRTFTFKEIGFGGWGIQHIWIEGIGCSTLGFFYPEMPKFDVDAFLKCYSYVSQHICDIPNNLYSFNNLNKDLEIYQSDNFVRIVFNEDLKKEIEIINVIGQVVRRISTSENDIEIDLDNLRIGLFILRVNSNNDIICKTLYIH